MDGVRIPRVQSHRGLCIHGAIENTLGAFRQAKKHGALMVECDVQLTKDKVPICFHDRDLERIAKNSSAVSELSLSEIQSIFSSICSLEELLLDYESPHLINIELKTAAIANESLERRVCDLIKKHRAQNRVLFSSFNPASLWKLSYLMPEVPRALILSSDIHHQNNLLNFLLRNGFFSPFLQIHALHLNYKEVTPSGLAKIKKAQIPFSLWTLPTKEEGEKMLSLGALSIISDNWIS